MSAKKVLEVTGSSAAPVWRSSQKSSGFAPLVSVTLKLTHDPKCAQKGLRLRSAPRGPSAAGANFHT